MRKKIKQIEFKDNIRKRLGMYLGGSGSKGIINLLKGLISDCIKLTTAEKYVFQIELKSDWEFVLDIKATNDISRFTKTSNETDPFKNFHLNACKVLCSEFSIVNHNADRVLLKFRLDHTVFTEPIEYFDLSEVFFEWTYLNRNTETLLIDKRGEFLNQNYFSFPEGVKYVYDRLVKDSLGKPEFEIEFEGVLNGRTYQIFLGYRTDWYPSSAIVSFTNDVHTVCGGSLVDGVMKGFIKGCKKYVKDNNLTDFKIRKKKFTNGLILIASVRGDEFNFGGSFKASLEDDKVKKDIKKLVKHLITDFMLNNTEKAGDFLRRFDDKTLLNGIF